jgi:hypothetical protein
MKSTPLPLSPKQLLFQGVAGCLLGIFLGLLNVLLVMRMSPDTYLLNHPFALLALFASCGIIAGAIQGGFLRRVIRTPFLWLALSGMGWLFIGCIDILTVSSIPVDVDVLLFSLPRTERVIGLLLGGLAALPQWVLLQRSIPLAGLWLLLSASTWYLVLLAMNLQQGRFQHFLTWIANWVL